MLPLFCIEPRYLHTAGLHSGGPGLMYVTTLEVFGEVNLVHWLSAVVFRRQQSVVLQPVSGFVWEKHRLDSQTPKAKKSSTRRVQTPSDQVQDLSPPSPSASVLQIALDRVRFRSPATGGETRNTDSIPSRITRFFILSTQQLPGNEVAITYHAPPGGNRRIVLSPITKYKLVCTSDITLMPNLKAKSKLT